MHLFALPALPYALCGMQIAAAQTFWGLAMCAWSPGPMRGEK